MSKPVTISLYEHENITLKGLEKERKTTASNIVRQAMELACTNPQLFQSYLDFRSDTPNYFDPIRDGFRSDAFINTLYENIDGKWSTCFGILVNCGLMRICVPVHTEIDIFKTGKGKFTIKSTEATFTLLAECIENVELYDLLTGESYPFKLYSKDRWPKNFSILIKMCGEEE